MLRLLLSFFIIVPFISIVYAQYNPGARQVALANSDAAQANDVFSLFNNPGGLAQMNWREIGVYYSPAPFGFSELANAYIGYNEPLSFGSVSAGAMTYGFELYRETRVIAGFAYNYQNRFFAGVTLNYQSVSIKNYGNAGCMYVDFGALLYLTGSLRWGFSVHNINQASYGKYDDQVPVIFNAGVSFDITDEFTLNTAIEKDIRYKASLMIGIDYDIIKYFSLRTGFSNEPSRFAAGIGIHYEFLNLDYAVFTHNDLGLTHQAGIIISFDSDNPRKLMIRENLGIK